MSKRPKSRSHKSSALRRRVPWGWLLVLGAIAMFGGIVTVDLWWPGGGTPRTLAATPEQTAHGAALFQKFCKDCHGEQARGENPAEPQGGGKPGGGYLAPALNATGHAHHHPPEVLWGYLQKGSPAADSPMRSFRDRMSEDDMRAVLGYVWSLWPQSLQQGYARAHGL